MEIMGVVLVSILIVVIIIVLILNPKYVKCPTDKVLIVYGFTFLGESYVNNYRKWSIVISGMREHDFLSLETMTLDINLQSALTVNKNRVNVKMLCGVKISDEHLNNAGNRLLKLDESDIKNFAIDIIVGKMRLLIAYSTIKSIKTMEADFLKSLRDQADPELEKLGLKLVDMDIISVT